MSANTEWQPLAITIDRTLIAVSGELDIATAPELSDTLSRTDGEPVNLDLSRVSFIDPAGLRVLLTAKRDIDARGGQLVIRNPSWEVQRIARLSGTADDLGVENRAEP
jgi:anti-sigma B factor antagonist